MMKTITIRKTITFDEFEHGFEPIDGSETIPAEELIRIRRKGIASMISFANDYKKTHDVTVKQSHTKEYVTITCSEEETEFWKHMLTLRLRHHLIKGNVQEI